ncbi:12189_t:CDS:2 [Ambispora gerdemannii]|uniref:12189_t:CDS:1 n=1 Tax=Ambispora gerdemannii TaxID=144530 RepID=A0A9N9BSI9_9GLOM|nr:12189_t:CDS:2 [Ambispora gerdemannii]
MSSTNPDQDPSPSRESVTTTRTIETTDPNTTIIEHIIEETEIIETIVETEELPETKSESETESISSFNTTTNQQQNLIAKTSSSADISSSDVNTTIVEKEPIQIMEITPKVSEEVSHTTRAPKKDITEIEPVEKNITQEDYSDHEIVNNTQEVSPQPTKIQFIALEKPERTKTIEPPPNNAIKVQAPPKVIENEDDKKDVKSVDINEHLLTADEVADRYKVTINTSKPLESRGLDSKRVADLLKQNGQNILTPPKKKSAIFKYLECLSTLFNVLLIIAGILMYIVLAVDYENNKANIYIGAILIGVALLNAFIEFYQLQKSAAILESFLSLIPQKCRVLREGKLNQIQAADLVVGDIVSVGMGDKIPADLYLFSATDMKVDNSSLTGEADPQERTPHNSHKNPLEATNLCFYGTLCVSGEGYGIVIRGGDHTVLGQIAGLTAGEEKSQSPLSEEIDNFVKIIATIAIVTSVVFFLVGLKVYDGSISLTLSFAISILVAWVPQGLPATVTVLLAIAAKKMAAQNVLVKDLQGVETLGAITLLATDKTGTLTRNQMTVTYIWSSLNIYSASRGAQNDPNIAFDLDAPGIQEVIHISSLCSRVKFDRTDVPFNERQILGDATETGLIRFAAQNLDDFDALITAYPKVFEIPFNSETKWALTIHTKPHDNGDLTLYIKGAPERVLKLCTTILFENKATPLTDEHKEKYNEIYEFMASKGHRVLAFAQLLLPRSQYPENYQFKKEEKNFPLDGFCFVGLVSLEDPPKHGVREAIGKCRTAGIRVMMVTGDHPLTAEAIGRKINLMLSDTKELVAKHTGRPIESIQEDEYNAIVIHGEQIDTLTDEQWDNIFAKNEIIFARTSPKHKLEIVKRAQSMGHIVGVTGDGVNDSPALKKANLGIAMNQSGSDVSKEAAAMILLDDNFASTVQGIAEGRLIFTNLKKSIRYTISHSTPEVFVTLLYVLIPIPLPLPPLLILVIDLGFELFIALSYAWDKPESETGLMKLPPRKPVTPTTINRFRRLALERTPTVIDPGTGKPIVPSRISRFLHSIKKLFNLRWWANKFESTEGEVLVDGELLSWAYLEIGVIEAICSILAFFVVLNHHHITPYDARQMQTRGSYFKDDSEPYSTANGYVVTGPKQKEALGQAAAIVYLSIMIQQMFNLFAVKGRYRLPFGKFIFSNPRNFAGILFGAILAMCIVYIPPFNEPFGTHYKLSPIFWLIPFGFGIFILIYACIRILVLRRGRPVHWNPEIQGLQMYPTVRSVERKA